MTMNAGENNIDKWETVGKDEFPMDTRSSTKELMISHSVFVLNDSLCKGAKGLQSKKTICIP